MGRTRQKNERKLKATVSLCLRLLAAACIAALIVMSLMVRSKLTEESDRIRQLDSELAELQDENRRLKIEYGEEFSPEKVTEYAENELGMQKPSADQISSTDTGEDDKSVILQNEG